MELVQQSSSSRAVWRIYSSSLHQMMARSDLGGPSKEEFKKKKKKWAGKKKILLESANDSSSWESARTTVTARSVRAPRTVGELLAHTEGSLLIPAFIPQHHYQPWPGEKSRAQEDAEILRGRRLQGDADNSSLWLLDSCSALLVIKGLQLPTSLSLPPSSLKPQTWAAKALSPGRTLLLGVYAPHRSRIILFPTE